MVSARRTLSSAEQSVGQTTINTGTSPAETNASRATQPATENAYPGISPVETSVGETRIAPGSESVMDLV